MKSKFDKRSTLEAFLGVTNPCGLSLEQLNISNKKPFDQCDQIGRLWKVLGNKKPSKEAQMIGNFLGSFEKPHSHVKLHRLLFGQLFENIGLHFNSTSGHTAIDTRQEESRKKCIQSY